MRTPATPLPHGPAHGGRVAIARVASLLLCTALAAPSARADDADDHERARAAVQAGEVLPLATLLERLRPTHPGEVLELKLERDDGRWIYELKLLEPGGRVAKLEVDARTAEVLKLRRKPAPAAKPAR